MRNNLFLPYIIIFISLICCRTSPTQKVKIIEERDPIVKNIEEKDSIRIVTDTINKVSRKK